MAKRYPGNINPTNIDNNGCATLSDHPTRPNSILYDCKSFYRVFCYLEEYTKFPWGDSQAIETYAKEDRGSLTPASITNGVFAAELALKYLAYIDHGEFECVHKLDVLFDSLSDTRKSRILDGLKEKGHSDKQFVMDRIKEVRDFFDVWRYYFQYKSIGFTGFLYDFIHVVCDYAMECEES